MTANLGAAASPASTDAAGGACRPRDASRPPSRAVRPPRMSSPPDRPRTAGRPSSGSAPARSDLHGRGVGGALSPTRDQRRSWHRDDRPRGARGRARSKRRWRPRQRAVRCELRLLPTAGVTPIPLTTFSRSSGHRSCESHFELERPESRSSSHVKTLGGRYTANTRRRDHRIVGGTRKFLRCNDGRFWHMAVDFVSAATPSAFYRYRFLGGPWPPTGSTQASKRESNVRGSQ